MRSLMLAAVAALAFATAAIAAPGAISGPYKLDANGKCHGPNGQFVTTSLCAPPPKHPVCNPAKSKPCGKVCIPLAKTCHV